MIRKGGKGRSSGGADSAALANKVDKVDGKGLSTNDYTTTEKNKLAGMTVGTASGNLATVGTVDAKVSAALSPSLAAAMALAGETL